MNISYNHEVLDYGKLKVKIEKVQDPSDLNISDEQHKNQQSFDQRWYSQVIELRLNITAKYFAHTD